MNGERRVFIVCLIVMTVVIFIAILTMPSSGKSEDWLETTDLYVTAKLLNGRCRPSKKAKVESLFDRGDRLEAYDWSKNHHWIEVKGGESGTVWVWYEYVTEQTEDYSVWINDYGSKIKIRKEPFGKVIGYLDKGKELVITQVLLGWGKCDRGWIELRYLTEED